MLTKVFLDLVAAEVTNAAISAALTKPRELLTRFNADAQFQAAIDEHNADILWMLHAVAIAVARAVHGRDLDAESAMRLLLKTVGDPRTRHRFAALSSEARNSASERVAMLAAGYFVGAEPTSPQDRLDWAVRQLFAADVEVLGTIVELNAKLQPGEALMVTERREGPHDVWIAVPSVGGEIRQLLDGPALSGGSLRALAAAQCLAMSGEADPEPNLMVSGGGLPGEIVRAHSVEVLALGRELHRILSTVDWREIARRRETERT